MGNVIVKEAYLDLLNKGLTMDHVNLYAQQQEVKKDTRYNVPKEEPKASQESINQTIMETEIYRKAKLAILQAQKKQVAYGIDKYPEPLNSNTWSTLETIDHIIDESIDKLHYLVMLRIKMEQQLVCEKTDDAVNDCLDAIRYVAAGSDMDDYTLRVFTDDELDKLAGTHVLIDGKDITPIKAYNIDDPQLWTVDAAKVKQGYVGYNIEDVMAKKAGLK